MAPRLKIGLTGGIASGKSTVARCFEELGVPVIDADLLAREVVEPGRPALEEITLQFGPRSLTPDGHLDRRWLRKHVFIEDEARTVLENILHPRIRNAMRKRTMALDTPYCILCIPLLIEANHPEQADRILVVDVPEKLQISRARRRDSASETEIKAILRAQVSRKRRLAAADDVILNDAGLAELATNVASLHHYYLGLATPDLPATDE